MLRNGKFQELHEERTPVELHITGSIPAYAAGALYRTGPGIYKIDREKDKDFVCNHWFDGIGHTHRFEITAQADGSTKVFYNSRRQNDRLIARIKKNGTYGQLTFGQKHDPCVGLFGKVMSVFQSGSKDPQMTNTSVAVLPNYSRSNNTRACWLRRPKGTSPQAQRTAIMRTCHV